MKFQFFGVSAVQRMGNFSHPPPKHRRRRRSNMCERARDGKWASDIYSLFVWHADCLSFLFLFVRRRHCYYCGWMRRSRPPPDAIRPKWNNWNFVTENYYYEMKWTRLTSAAASVSSSIPAQRMQAYKVRNGRMARTRPTERDGCVQWRHRRHTQSRTNQIFSPKTNKMQIVYAK